MNAMNCKTPYLSRMDEILSEKRKSGLRGIKLFVPKSDDCTAEDIARGYCLMEQADRNKHFKDISRVAL